MVRLFRLLAARPLCSRSGGWLKTKQHTIGATLQSATEWIFIPTMYSMGITILCFFTSRRIFWPASFGSELFGYWKEFLKFHGLLCRTSNKYPSAFLFMNFCIYRFAKPGLGVASSVSYHLLCVAFHGSFAKKMVRKMN